MSSNITNHRTGAVEQMESNDDSKKKKGAPKKQQQQASMGETLSFVFECGPKITLIFFAGVIGGVLNGFVFPILAYLFSSSFTDIAGATTNGLGPVRKLAYTFMIVGVYALVAGTVQSWSFEIISYHATQNLRLQWFAALLRQDAAFFDVNDVSGIAGQVGPSTIKYRRGLGRKFGEGIQFLTTGVGGVGFAMWSSWRVALVVLALVPIMAATALAVIQLNQSKGTRGAAAYKTAGSVAYTTVSAIKTVLSLNAISIMIQKYSEATQSAYIHATGILVKQGLANGALLCFVIFSNLIVALSPYLLTSTPFYSNFVECVFLGGMLGSFLLLYCILALYGTALLYKDVEDSGCDPSGIVTDNDTCTSNGADVFGAMLGMMKTTMMLLARCFDRCC
jgi:ATP-binding cassette, subfamily B (MDR/TAP), member 1